MFVTGEPWRRITEPGDGAGVLLPLPAALLPEPGLGIAMVFLRDPDGRRAVEEACRAEGIAVRGWRPVPVDLEALGAAAQLSAADDRAGAARAARGRRRRRSRRLPSAPASASTAADDLYVASLSFRTVVYKALCAADQLAAVLRRPARPGRRGSVRDLPPALLDEHRAVVGARAAVPAPLPQRRDQRDPRQRQLDARPRGLTLGVDGARPRGGELRLGDARQRARAARARRPRRAPCADDARFRRPGRETPSSTRRCATSTASTPGWSSRGTGRPASSSRTAASSARRSTATACALFATSSPATSSAARPRRASSTCRPEHVLVGAGSGRARCSPSITERGLEEDASDQAAARGRCGRTGAGSKSGDARRPSVSRRRRRRRTSRPATSLFGYTREELTVIVRPSAAHGHEPTSSMGDDTALPPLAGRARPLFSYFRQRFAQVTNPPIDHIRERFVMSLSHAARRAARRCSWRRPRTRRASSSRASSSTRPPSTSSPSSGSTRRFDPAEGLESACARLAQAAETAVREGHGMLLVTDTDASPERPPVPILLATSVVHHHLVKAGLRTLATLLVESDEPREVHHVACLLGFGAEAVCPRLALQTIAALAEGDRIGGDRPVAGRGAGALQAVDRGRRAQGDVEDRDLRRRQLLRRADLRGARPRRRSCRGRLSRHALVDRRDRPRRSWRRRRSRAPAPPTGTRPRLENPGYFKFRKGGEPHETNPDVLEALQAAARSDDMGAAHALRSAVRTNGWERYSDFAELVNGREPMEVRDLLELRAGRAAGPARRGRAGRVDRAALLVGRHVARLALRRGARDDRARVQQSRRPLELRRGRGGPGALPHRPELARSSRSPRAASASRPSTRRSPTSSRSRSRRARSPARAASCPATR